MASVAELIAELDAVAESLGEAMATLDRSAASWERASDGYAEAFAGSHDPAADELHQRTSQASRSHTDAVELIRAALGAIEAMVTSLRGQGSAPVAAASAQQRSWARNQVVADELRRIGRTSEGGKAVGALIRENGTAEPMESGDGTPWYAATRAELTALGKAGDPAARLKRLATHIEMQVVVRIARELSESTRRAGTTPAAVHIPVVVSREPCGFADRPPTPFRCDKQLGAVIRKLWPPESTLTVIDPTGREWTYPKGPPR